MREIWREAKRVREILRLCSIPFARMKIDSELKALRPWGSILSLHLSLSLWTRTMWKQNFHCITIGAMACHKQHLNINTCSSSRKTARKPPLAKKWKVFSALQAILPKPLEPLSTFRIPYLPPSFSLSLSSSLSLFRTLCGHSFVTALLTPDSILWMCHVKGKSAGASASRINKTSTFCLPQRQQQQQVSAKRI